MEAIMNFIQATGFYQIATGDWKVLIMMIIAFVLLYLAIVKKFEPLLLLPIAFGMLITNLPGAEMYHEILFAGGHVNWEIFGGQPITQEFMNHLGELGVSEAVQGTVSVGQTISVGLLDVLYLGVKLGIYPCLIFMGVGAGTDFGPLIANPKTLLLGAAAQVGIFMTFVGCKLSTLFTNAQAASMRWATTRASGFFGTKGTSARSGKRSTRSSPRKAATWRAKATAASSPATTTSVAWGLWAKRAAARKGRAEAATPSVASVPSSSFPQNASRQPDFSKVKASASMSTAISFRQPRLRRRKGAGPQGRSFVETRKAAQQGGRGLLQCTS